MADIERLLYDNMNLRRVLAAACRTAPDGYLRVDESAIVDIESAPVIVEELNPVNSQRLYRILDERDAK